VLENGGLIYSLPVVMTCSTAGAIGLKSGGKGKGDVTHKKYIVEEEENGKFSTWGILAQILDVGRSDKSIIDYIWPRLN
jgi:hypothetical protein